MKMGKFEKHKAFFCHGHLLARCASANFRARAFLPPRRRFFAAAAPSAVLFGSKPSPAPGRSAVTCCR